MQPPRTPACRTARHPGRGSPPARCARAVRCAGCAAVRARAPCPRCACAAPPRPGESTPLPAPASCRTGPHAWPRLRAPRVFAARSRHSSPGHTRSCPRSSSTIRVARRRTKARSWLMNSSAPAKLQHHVFEPGDGVDIQMIGRLVQQQQIGRRRRARGPASRAAASRPTARSSAHPARAAAARSLDRLAARPANRHRRLALDRPPMHHLAHRMHRSRRRPPGPGWRPARPGRTHTSPLSATSCRVISCSSEDLPSPLRPSRQTRSPLRICRSTLSNKGLRPKLSETLSRRTVGMRRRMVSGFATQVT